MKRKKLTQSDLDEIHRELMKCAVKPVRNQKGEPVYMLRVVGTKRELRFLRRKLKELE